MKMNSSPYTNLHRNYLKYNDDSAQCYAFLSSNNRANVALLTMPYHHNSKTLKQHSQPMSMWISPLHSLPREAHTLKEFAHLTTTTLLRCRRGSNQIISALHRPPGRDSRGWRMKRQRQGAPRGAVVRRMKEPRSYDQNRGREERRGEPLGV